MRLVKCNDLDLSLFQFDYDLTFAVLFLNADRTVYARYGTRTSQHSADRDVSLDGLAASMQEVLRLHENYPDNKQQFAGKQPDAVKVVAPEEYPSLKQFKPTLDYDGQVAKSCIHCHQIREAQRLTVRQAKQPLPADLLFPYPAPDTIGIQLDAKSKSTIAEIIKESAAANAGLASGDEVQFLNGQPIASAADIQWVLQHSSNGDQLNFKVSRDGKLIEKELTLPDAWRNSVDIAWRPTSWDLRRMANGGVLYVELDKAAKAELGLGEKQMALLAKHVGQYGDHAIAKNAGVQKGDVLIEVDGRSDFLSESQLLEYGVTKKKPGETINLTLLRDGRKINAKFAVQ